MTVGKYASIIAGGIDVVGGTVKCGGHTKVVGENSKWFMRDKYISLKYLSDATSASERSLLKILSLKIPLHFGQQIGYYDDDEKGMPTKTTVEVDDVLHEKAIGVLNEYMSEPVTQIIKRLVDQYKLQDPLFWVMGELIRFLAFTHKKRAKTKGMIKVSPELSLIIEQIWRGKNYFKYDINKDKAPTGVRELLVCMLDHLEKTKPPRGEWTPPKLIPTTYPVLTKEIRNTFEKNIMLEKKKLEKIKKTGVEETKEYVLAVLNMENVLIEWLHDIEQYYVDTATNISRILDSVKVFFR
jgi:hypothetical protein